MLLSLGLCFVYASCAFLMSQRDHLTFGAINVKMSIDKHAKCATFYCIWYMLLYRPMTAVFCIPGMPSLTDYLTTRNTFYGTRYIPYLLPITLLLRRTDVRTYRSTRREFSWPSSKCLHAENSIVQLTYKTFLFMKSYPDVIF